MKRSAVLLFLLMLSCFAMGAEEVSEPVNIPDEYSGDVDAMAAYIKRNCKDTRQMLWTLQNWLSENVVYDFSALDAQSKFQDEDLANWTLRNRKGVCANYASLFSEVSNRMGIPMFVIRGYDSKNNFKRISGAHAWCACIIDSVPYMFDPTWSSGYVNEDASEYYKRLDSKYFMASPDSFKERHIPYDPLMRLGAKVSSDQTSGDTINLPTMNEMGWLDSLTAYFQLDPIELKKAIYDRMIRNGDKNKYAVEYAAYVKSFIDNHTLEEQQDRCRRMIDQISNLQNHLEELNFVSPGADRSMHRAIEEFRSELDDALSQTETVTTPDLSKFLKDVRQNIQMLNKRVDKCESMLKKKKR